MSYFTRWALSKATERVPRYFSGDRRVLGVEPMAEAEFLSRFPGAPTFLYLPGAQKDPRWRGVRAVGRTAEGELLPITRMVAYKEQGASLHACGGKCQNAKGPDCECICGGANHGIMNNVGLT